MKCAVVIFDVLGVLHGDCVAEITRANEEMIKVMNVYDEVINKADIGSLLVDNNHGEL